jgi:ribonuclease P protein component
VNCETNVPTERAQARQDPWLPKADVHSGRAGCHSVAPIEGASSALCVTCPDTWDPVPKARIDRIRSRATFAALRRSGKRGRSGSVSVTFLEQPSWSRPQLAFAISRKVGNAVARNRLRRQLRALFTEERRQVPAGAYLVSTGPGAAGLPFDELRKSMDQALRAATGNKSAGAVTGDMAAGR